MTPKQQFICKLAGIILGALTPIVLALLTFLQGQGNRAAALREHDRIRPRRYRSAETRRSLEPVPEPTPGPEFAARRTDMVALEPLAVTAADSAADDTATVMVKPMWFQSKPRRMMVKSLRGKQPGLVPEKVRR